MLFIVADLFTVKFPEHCAGVRKGNILSATSEHPFRLTAYAVY